MYMYLHAYAWYGTFSHNIEYVYIYFTKELFLLDLYYV